MRIVFRASICSEMRWMPISAVMAEPARAVIMMAVRTGPSSRMRESATSVPSDAFRAEFDQGVVGLKAEDHAGEQADQEDDQGGRGPDVIDLLENLGAAAWAGRSWNARKRKIDAAPKLPTTGWLPCRPPRRAR